jgi:hypothetical protein
LDALSNYAIQLQLALVEGGVDAVPQQFPWLNPGARDLCYCCGRRERRSLELRPTSPFGFPDRRTT